MSKTILANVNGFVPLIDCIVKEVGLIEAAIFGRIWRYCQMKDGVCKVPLQRIADELGLSRKTVQRHAKALCEKGYLENLTPDLTNSPHIYRDTGKAQMQIDSHIIINEKPVNNDDLPGQKCPSRKNLPGQKVHPAWTESPTKDSIEDSIGDTNIVSSNKNKDRGTKRRYGKNSDEFLLTEFCIHKIQQNHPHISFTSTQKQKICDMFNRLIRIDKKTPEQIKAVIEFATGDVREGFCWADQFRSPLKLRRTNKEGIKYIDVFLSEMHKGRHPTSISPTVKALHTYFCQKYKEYCEVEYQPLDINEEYKIISKWLINNTPYRIKIVMEDFLDNNRFQDELGPWGGYTIKALNAKWNQVLKHIAYWEPEKLKEPVNETNIHCEGVGRI